MKEKIIVFAGPTISHQEIHAILPEALCHAPIKCGDILKALRLSPTMLVIIDGNFGHIGSAWHKEIMLALSNKIKVLGAASMGALRAAELDNLGMIGHGEIYHLYKSGQINGDDEVAIIHVDSDNNYQPSTLALVNIRCTLNKAINEGITTKQVADKIIEQIKYLPYFERNFARVTDAISDKVLIQWFRDNYIDQKKMDAISLLQQLTRTNELMSHDTQLGQLNNTFYLRKLYRDMICSHFDYPYDWLPEIEHKIYSLRDKYIYKHYVLLARLLHVVYDMSENEDQIFNAAIFIEDIKTQVDNDKVNKVLKYYFLYMGNVREDTKDKRSSLFYSIAVLIEYIVSFVVTNKIKINALYGNEFFTVYRRNNNLLKADDLRRWLEINNMSEKLQYNDFLFYASILFYIIEKGNVDYLNIKTSMNNVFWLSEAIKLHTHSSIEGCD